MKVKEVSEKADLRFNIRKMKIMASRPISSWQIDREKLETVTDFVFLGSKITADGDCSHVIKRHSMVFPVVRYGCESWTVKKAEHRRIDAFEL